MIITVDGVSGSGKTTIARKLAQELDFAFFSAGLFYRAITLNAILNNIPPTEDEKLIFLLNNSSIVLTYNKDGSNSCILNGKDVTEFLENENISKNVAYYACKSYVLDYVHKMEKQTAKLNPNIVMDGRDIGSVVFPQANLKLFVTCSVEIRAIRRTHQLESKGEKVEYQEVLDELIKRDKKDETRDLCPLVKPDDAYTIDTSNITITKGVVKALHYASFDPICKEYINEKETKSIMDYFKNTYSSRNLEITKK